jgi:DNA-directed RNA polymerase subunit L
MTKEEIVKQLRKHKLNVSANYMELNHPVLESCFIYLEAKKDFNLINAIKNRTRILKLKAIP